jgi:hypothetical protein
LEFQAHWGGLSRLGAGLSEIPRAKAAEVWRTLCPGGIRIALGLLIYVWDLYILDVGDVVANSRSNIEHSPLEIHHFSSS